MADEVEVVVVDVVVVVVVVEVVVILLHNTSLHCVEANQVLI